MEGTSLIHARRMENHAGFAFIVVVAELLAAGWNFLAGKLEAFAAAQRNARIRQELSQLSDHYLRDIGLERRQINQIFR